MILKVEELTKSRIGRVKLGANHGSGFVFCGDLSENAVKRADKELVDGYKESKERFRKSILFLKSQPLDYEHFEKECKKLGEANPYRDFHEWRDAKLKEIDRRQKVVKAIRAKIRTYESILTRDVVETYPSISEPNTTIVLFEGSELGSYWTIGECSEAQQATTRKKQKTASEGEI